jgi:hypothetical protein
MRFKSSRVLVALVAVFAIGAVAAASASAYTNPILENAKGEHVSKVKFTGEEDSLTFPVVNRELVKASECSSEKNTGELSTTGTGAAATTAGTTTLLFKGCKVSGLCKMTGSGMLHEGEVEVKLALSLVWVGKESEEKPGVRAAIPPLSAKPGNGEGGKLDMNCNTYTFDAEGAYIARTSRPLGEEFTRMELIAKETAAKQEDKTYTVEGKEGEIHLYSSWRGEPFEEAATELQYEEQAYGEAVKIAKS